MKNTLQLEKELNFSKKSGKAMEMKKTSFVSLQMHPDVLK